MSVWEMDGYTISTEKGFLDIRLNHRFLSGAHYGFCALEKPEIFMERLI